LGLARRRWPGRRLFRRGRALCEFRDIAAGTDATLDESFGRKLFPFWPDRIARQVEVARQRTCRGQPRGWRAASAQDRILQRARKLGIARSLAVELEKHGWLPKILNWRLFLRPICSLKLARSSEPFAHPDRFFCTPHVQLCLHLRTRHLRRAVSRTERADRRGRAGHGGIFGRGVVAIAGRHPREFNLLLGFARGIA